MNPAKRCGGGWAGQLWRLGLPHPQSSYWGRSGWGFLGWAGAENSGLESLSMSWYPDDVRDLLERVLGGHLQEKRMAIPNEPGDGGHTAAYRAALRAFSFTFRNSMR
jgi:hypothetical protein